MSSRRTTIGLFIIFTFFMAASIFAQQSGSLWIKTNKPGSADFNDETVDKKALQFLDSLMQRDDIVVTFLGGADQLPWKGLPKNSKLSHAIDQAKKLERALALRNRYGKGEIGVTDESIRGVKVVWRPKPPDAFELKKDLEALKAANDSLRKMVQNNHKGEDRRLLVVADSLARNFADQYRVHDQEVEHIFADWEIKTGMAAWTGGSPYDLLVPTLGISLSRMYWAFEFSGGFTPWSQKDALGERGDALLSGTISFFPRNRISYHLGAFSGWEFLTKTDNWTMKVMGVTVGPSIKWKFFELYAGYAFARLSTLTGNDRWKNGLLAHLNFKFLIN
ncbi:MAG: hypothetical protein GXO74_10530 [Calditrichaeota bacterium]|nr:hypothetical protein [Calditrichota bacterium]